MIADRILFMKVVMPVFCCSGLFASACAVVLSGLMLGFVARSPAPQVDSGQALSMQQEILWKHGHAWLGDQHLHGMVWQRDQNGRPRFIGGFARGLPNGVHQHWSAQGVMLEWQQWALGGRHGFQLRRWPEGGLRRLVTYRFDSKEGRERAWYRNGQLAEDLNWRYNAADGRQRYWSEDGVLRTDVVFRNGRRYGALTPKPCYTGAQSQP